MKFTLPSVVLSAFGLLCISLQVHAAKILAVVPTPSYSHQIPYRKLLRELHDRGHEIVLVTSDPIPNMDSKTFQQIDVSESYKDVRAVDFMQFRFNKVDYYDFLQNFAMKILISIVENVLNHTDMKAMYAPNSNWKFDLVMAEMHLMPAIFAFAHRFDAPMIGLSSLGLSSMDEYALGGVFCPSHDSTWELGWNVGIDTPFLKRVENFFLLSWNIYGSYRDIVLRQQKLAEGYMGPLPPLMDILKNTSVVFVNQIDAITPAKPRLPNIITFNSFHIEKNPPPLPTDLKQFLDDATDGFIYFNLGSNALSSSMPKESLQIFLDVFSELPYRVVFKFEKYMPNKPDNIFIGEWLPQQSILAHPNIKLFIYQGGAQSTEEAIQFSVPIIGFPILADQEYQIHRLADLGVAKYMDITTITREELRAAIREVLTDKEYKEKIIALKELVNDTPYDMLEHLSWWVEYVIRYKGAPHLRSNLAHQPWYQRHDADIVVFLAIVLILIILIVTRIITKMAAQRYFCDQSIYPSNKQSVQ